MKNLIFGLATILLIALVACNNNKEKKDLKMTDMMEMNHDNKPLDSDSIDNKSFHGNSQTKELSQPFIENYLNLKDALVSDDASSAAIAAKLLLASTSNIDMKAIPSERHERYMEIAKLIAENSNHIAKNVENISHQREYFELLSQNINELIMLFGSSQTLYKDFCSMFNEGKGGVWISQSKEIKNPFYGKEMLTCGEVKEIIR